MRSNNRSVQKDFHLTEIDIKIQRAALKVLGVGCSEAGSVNRDDDKLLTSHRN